MSSKTRWQLIEDLFAEAVDLDPRQRTAFLDSHCQGDPDLRAEIESLLHSSEAAPEFLDQPILNAVRNVADEQTPDLREGTPVAHYVIVKPLGSGGMGQVYVAQDTRLKRNVALKVLSQQLTRHATGMQRFEHEAQAASALNHPNILTIFEFGEADGLHFMASELVLGHTLRDRLADGPMTVPCSLDIAAQVAGALAAAHTNGILHRDIKPENIVIRSDGLVKLLDFGIAKLTEQNPMGAPATNLTAAGMVLGTLKYMSPEQARGVRVDARSDIFSLGAVLYEMVTGKEPFQGETSSDVIAEILKSDPPPLDPAIAAAFPELETILGKAMRKDREARYQTAAEFSQDLLQLKRDIEFQAHSRRGADPAGSPLPGSVLVASSGPQELPVSPGQALSALTRYLQSWRIRLALLAVVLAAAAALFLLPRPPHTPPQTRPRSLAILPFQNLKPDPQSDFLGFSLADALITKLAYVRALNLRPSSAVDKYRNQAVDPRKVAAELQVDTLLTGSYLKDGDDLRINTQLVDTKVDRIIWQDTLDLTYDKLLTVQDRVSQEIVSGPELNLSPAEATHLKPDAPIDARAYEYYLRGVDYYSLNDFAAAIAILEKSVDIQPDYAPAWAEMGRASETQASLHAGGRDLYQKAQSAYERAITLSPSLVEPRVDMANLFTDTGRVEQAVPLLRDALKTSPNNAPAHWELGYAYRFGGMLAQSVEEGERARGFDPQVKINSSAMNGYLYLSQYDKFLQSLPANNSAYVLFYRGFAEYHQKQWKLATADFDRAYELDSTLIPAQLGRALSNAIAHQNAQGLALLRKTEARVESQGVADAEMIYKLAQAYAVLGDHASALRELQRAIEGGFFCYPYFMRDPLLDGIRNEPGFDQQMQEARRRHEEFKARFF